MKSSRRKAADSLKQAVDALRRAEPAPGEVESAAARVWARIAEEFDPEASAAPVLEPAVGTIRGCDDYRSLIPGYLAGQLPAARTLLLEDHMRECVACRQARTAAHPVRPSSARPAAKIGPRRWKWVAPAAAALLIALGWTQADSIRRLIFPIELRALAQTVEGRLFRVDRTGLIALNAGAEIGADEPLRTGDDSRAIVELEDGSRVEMRERSEIALAPAPDGVRIEVGRGSIIVRAADQGAGHLYVSAGDVDVTVVGTVFSVSEGNKGARVSVIEGEVRVEHGRLAQALFPGQQYNSSPALTPVPIEEEIAWSQEFDQHLALLLQFSRMREELQTAIQSPELRYGSTLIAHVPRDTAVYAAFPNVARTLASAYDVFSRRIEENPVTREWWNQLSDGAQSPRLAVEEMMTMVRGLSNHIGREVVLALAKPDAGPPEPLLLAEVRDAALVADLLRGWAAVASRPTFVVATDRSQLSAASGEDRPVAYVEGALLAFAPRVQTVIDAVSAGPGDAAFTSTAFYATLEAAYADGADWLFAADIDRLVAAADEIPDRLGLVDLQDLAVDHRSLAGQSATRAIMRFDRSRGGLASWLGDPAPMGGLEFVSPDTYGVIAGLTSDPASIVGEIFNAVQRVDAAAWNSILEFQQEHRIDIRGDLAAPLGGEFLLAIDGPILPAPSWKAVFEVYDSARLQNAIEWLVFEFNREAALENRAAIEMAAESVGGRTFYVIRLPGAGVEAHYTYSAGYMILAPSRALVIQALRYNETRYTLANSAAFQNLLPAGGQNYCSALIYQNMTSLASSIVESVPGAGASGVDAIREIAANTPATLACVIGETDRIIASTQGELAFDLATLGGFTVLMDTLRQTRP